MAELTLWQGGVKIIPQDEFDNQVKTQEGEMRFNTCKHRSENPVEKITRSCCSSSTREEAYECVLRNIFKLTSETCASCNVYQKKP